MPLLALVGLAGALPWLALPGTVLAGAEALMAWMFSAPALDAQRFSQWVM